MISRVTGIENKEAELRLWRFGLRRRAVRWIVFGAVVEQLTSHLKVEFL